VALIAGMSTAIAREAVHRVESVGMAELSGDLIVGIDGLSARETRHRIILNGVGLWTWCAYDIVGIAAALGADALGETLCGLCDRRIEVVVRHGSPDLSAIVGWYPQMNCSNVMNEFCPSALLFCSRSHLDRWRSVRGEGSSGHILNVNGLAERGRADWHQLVGPQA
jgi:hypothetical protein